MKSMNLARKLSVGAVAVVAACAGALAAAPAATAAPTSAAPQTGTTPDDRATYAYLDAGQVVTPDQNHATPARVGDEVRTLIQVRNLGNRAYDSIAVTREGSDYQLTRGRMDLDGFALLEVRYTVTAADLARGYFVHDYWARGYVGGVEITKKSFRVAEFVSAPAGPATLNAVANGKFVVAEHEGAGSLIANRSQAGLWEQFTISYNTDDTVSLRAGANGKYVTAENGGASALIANRTTVGPAEKFTLTRNADSTFSLTSVVNGKYVTAEDGGASALIANRTAIGPWEKFTITY